MRRRTRIKFCGITREIDAECAVALGVDALGFVFHPASPRYVTPARARELIRRLGPWVTAVGLFVDCPLDEVRRVVDFAGLDCVQFHGGESPDYCAAYAGPYLKAIQVRNADTATAAARAYPLARALLLDTWHPQLAGGTGQVFDWQLVPADLPLPVVLAGGLEAANVAQAIRQVRPYAVDVSGGIEQAKGIKDAAKMQAFVAEVNNIEDDR